MKKLFVVLLGVLAAAGMFAPAANAASKEKAKDRIVMDIGPTLDIGGGILYYPVGSRPVIFDKKDVGKAWSEIKNEATRAALQQIATDLYGMIRNHEDARLIAENAIRDIPLPPEEKARIVDNFVVDYNNMAANEFDLTSGRMYVDDGGGGCSFGDVCPGICGTTMPGFPQYCFTNLACINCGKVPK